ncbi:21803_t:CDS:10, partial [Gigaspora rosea]
DEDLDVVDEFNIDESNINKENNVDESNINKENEIFLSGQLKILQRAWLNENFSTEILPYEPAFERLNEILENQNIKAESLTLSQETSPIGMLLFIDNERIKYVMNRYKRTRLAKIEKYVCSINENAEYMARLSLPEKEFAERYKRLIEEHEHASFLHVLPQESLDVLKETENETSFATVEHPDLNQAVFCRFIKHVGSYSFPSTNGLLSHLTFSGFNKNPKSYQDRDRAHASLAIELLNLSKSSDQRVVEKALLLQKRLKVSLCEMYNTACQHVTTPLGAFEEGWTTPLGAFEEGWNQSSGEIVDPIWSRSKEIAESKVRLSLSEVLAKTNIKTTLTEEISSSGSQNSSDAIPIVQVEETQKDGHAVQQRNLNDLQEWKTKLSTICSEDAILASEIISFFHKCCRREINVLTIPLRVRDYILMVLGPLFGDLLQEFNIGQIRIILRILFMISVKIFRIEKACNAINSRKRKKFNAEYVKLSTDTTKLDMSLEFGNFNVEIMTVEVTIGLSYDYDLKFYFFTEMATVDVPKTPSAMGDLLPTFITTLLGLRDICTPDRTLRDKPNENSRYHASPKYIRKKPLSNPFLVDQEYELQKHK